MKKLACTVVAAAGLALANVAVADTPDPNDATVEVGDVDDAVAIDPISGDTASLRDPSMTVECV